MTLERATVEVDGRPVAVWSRGEGPTLLAIHGLFLDHRALATTLESTPGIERFRRLYVDLPGMGETPAAGHHPSSAAIVEVLDRVVGETIGTAPFVLVGQSYGGYLVRGLLARRPEQVRGMAMIVPVVATDPADRVVPAPVKRLVDDEAVAALPDAFLAEMRPFMVLESPGIVAELIRDFLPAAAAVDQDFTTTLQETGYALDPDALGNAFAGPALVICGRDDAIVGYEQALALRDELLDATIAVVAGAGHAVELERPGVVRSLLANWLQRVLDGGL